MTGQGSSSFESIASGKSKVNFINLAKVFKTADNNLVRGLVFRTPDNLRTNAIDRNKIIKGQYLHEDLETGTKTWKETEWLVTGVHATDSRLTLEEYKPVTPRLPKLFSGL